jgi:hypothetical protein
MEGEGVSKIVMSYGVRSYELETIGKREERRDGF